MPESVNRRGSSGPTTGATERSAPSFSSMAMGGRLPRGGRNDGGRPAGRPPVLRLCPSRSGDLDDDPTRRGVAVLVGQLEQQAHLLALLDGALQRTLGDLQGHRRLVLERRLAL